MDTGIIIAITGIGVAMVGVMVSMMFWMRGEANTLRAEAQGDRRDLLQISRNLEMTVGAIQNEMNDFHRKLLEIEKAKK